MISLSDLSALGIAVSLGSGGNLKLTSTAPPSREVVEQIKQSKLSIVEELRSRCDHSDPAKWQDHPSPNRPGWIQTTCVSCGRFIGNRPRQ